MKKIFKSLAALSIAALAGFSAVSCEEVLPDYSNTGEPQIKLILEELNPDLNRVDNTPIVCVIFSEAGLKSVKVYKHEDEVQTLLSEITTFTDEHQYSVKENPSWTESITKVSIEATDKAGRTVTAEINVNVTPILPAPVIVFEKEKIVIDERNEDPNNVNTVFDVTSSNQLQALKVALFTSEGILDYPLTGFKAGSESYHFEQEIEYFEGYRGLQVTATDVNGKMKIETLPISYIPAPSPVITTDESTSEPLILVRSSDSKTFTFNVNAEVGLSYIEVLKITKDSVTGDEKQVRLDVQYYDSNVDFNVDFSYTASEFDIASNGLCFNVVDRLNHESKLRITTLVDMRLGENIVLGSQRNTKEPLVVEGYPGEHYHFFSVRDFKTYSLFDFWQTENRRNIDFYYFAWNANQNRLMKANEDRADQDGSWYEYIDPTGVNSIPMLRNSESRWGNRNGTYIKRLTKAFAFDFDNVTLEDLTSTAVQNYLIQAKNNDDWLNYKVDDCFLFKTGPLSTYPNCTGIVRFETIVGDRDSFMGNNLPPKDKPVYVIISIKAQVIE